MNDQAIAAMLVLAGGLCLGALAVGLFVRGPTGAAFDDRGRLTNSGLLSVAKWISAVLAPILVPLPLFVAVFDWWAFFD
jgi:hypothetical protein